jgi:hypothetical protein
MYFGNVDVDMRFYCMLCVLGALWHICLLATASPSHSACAYSLSSGTAS